MQGFKLRAPPSPLIVATWRAIGAAPTSMNFSELYTALQTGVVEGQEGPLVYIRTNRLFEVQKYLSLTSHIWDGWYTLINPRAFGRLPKDMQDLVMDSFNQAGIDVRSRHRRAARADQGVPGREGHDRQHAARSRAVPPEAEGRRPLQGMEGEDGSGRLGAAGGDQRPAGRISAGRPRRLPDLPAVHRLACDAIGACDRTAAHAVPRVAVRRRWWRPISPSC